MTPAIMTELNQSRQQDKSGLVLSIKITVCPDLTNHDTSDSLTVTAKLCIRLN